MAQKETATIGLHYWQMDHACTILKEKGIIPIRDDVHHFLTIDWDVAQDAASLLIANGIYYYVPEVQKQKLKKNPALTSEESEEKELIIPRPGEHVLYKNGGCYELGKVKRVVPEENVAYVWYSEGETAARTPLETLMDLRNARTIFQTSLGGIEAQKMFDRTESYVIEGYDAKTDAREIICTAWSLDWAKELAEGIFKNHNAGNVVRSRISKEPFVYFIVCDKYGEEKAKYALEDPEKDRQVRIVIWKGDTERAYHVLESAGIQRWLDGTGKLLIYANDLGAAIEALARKGFEAEQYCG